MQSKAGNPASRINQSESSEVKLSMVGINKLRVIADSDWAIRKAEFFGIQSVDDSFLELLAGTPMAPGKFAASLVKAAAHVHHTQVKVEGRYMNGGDCSLEDGTSTRDAAKELGKKISKFLEELERNPKLVVDGRGRGVQCQ